MEVLILGVYFEIFLFRMKWSKIRVRIIHGRVLYTGKYGNWCILGDPGADSRGEGKSKRAENNGTKKSKERREEPLGTMCFLAPIRSQNGGDRLELVW